jgi:Ca2+-binding EF-hand superfamily protein
MDAMFKKKDADSNGQVSKDEFLKGAKDAAKAEKQFAGKDKDKSGGLSLEEFKAAGKKKAK